MSAFLKQNRDLKLSFIWCGLLKEGGVVLTVVVSRNTIKIKQKTFEVKKSMDITDQT